MIDAERMLGSLVREAMSAGGRTGRRRRRKRRRRAGSILGPAQKGALAMGALGVAIAAFEHFTNQPKAGASFSGGAAATPPPPPVPPPSGPSAAPPPPPPPPPGAATTSAAAQPEPAGSEALLLVRAMIAAANADHRLDDQERARIVDALDASGLGDEERSFVLAELEAPIGLAALAAGAATPELARQVYLASLLAIEVDTDAERSYLARLARQLGLGAGAVEELEGLLAAEEDPDTA